MTRPAAPVPVLTDPRCEALWRHSDTMALQWLAHHQRRPILAESEWRAILAHQEHTLNGRLYYNAHSLHGWYGKDVAQEYHALTQTLRWHVVLQHIGRIEAPWRVLDYGTQCGAHALEFSKRWPLAEVFGRDVVPDLPAIWHEAQRLFGGRVTFAVGDYLSPPLPDRLDLLYAGEVLEHIPDALGCLRAFEAACRPGALLCLTTPLGPWEATADRRLHVHHLEVEDWQVIAGHRPEFHVTRHQEYGRGCGFAVVSWRCPHDAIAPALGAINYQAKLQRWGFAAEELA